MIITREYYCIWTWNFTKILFQYKKWKN